MSISKSRIHNRLDKILAATFGEKGGGVMLLIMMIIRPIIIIIIIGPLLLFHSLESYHLIVLS